MGNEVIGLLRKLEWSGRVQGPGTSMGANNGTWHEACPICHGVKDSRQARGDFLEVAIGHKRSCRLVKVLRDHDARS